MHSHVCLGSNKISKGHFGVTPGDAGCSADVVKSPFMCGDRPKIGTVMDLGSVRSEGLPYEMVEAWATVSRSIATSVLPDARIFRSGQPKEHLSHSASQMMHQAPKQIQGELGGLKTYSALMTEAQELEAATFAEQIGCGRRR